MIEIDCSYGEGGGQIVRTAVALSALTGKAVHLYNIRAKRDKPGLQAQHLTGVKAVAELCKAKVSGAELHSTEITFEPNEISGGNYEWDIGTAGSVTLVLQALMPAMLFSKKEFSISITGGTNVHWSPPVEYFQHIFCDYMLKMGAKINFEIKKHGFYPKGGGRIKLRIQSSELKPIDILERGKFIKTDVWSVVSSDLMIANVAERQVKGFKHEFGETNYGNIKELYVSSLSSGTCVHAHNHYENCKIGTESLGERGKPSEAVGKECAERLKKEISHDSTLDTHMLDQILPYMAMLGGRFKFGELTSHAKTNIWVIENFLPVKFEIKGNVINCKKKS